MGQVERAGYKIVSEETWDAIKAAYLRGTSARRLARHYGVTVYAIYMRAQRQGWTRVAWAAQQPRPPPPRRAPAINRKRLAASALEGAATLLAEGRLEEVGAYLRLADMSSRI